jgi:putative YpdA family bacillithiol system oxidoreductase
MVIKDDGIYEKVKYWIKPNIENRIKEGSIKALFNSQIKEIRSDKIIVSTPDGEQIIDNDYVLAMTGYRPDYAFLKNIGISLDPETKAPLHNEKSLESNIPQLYIAGVILAGDNTSKLFIENTRHHGKQIISDIKHKISASYA